MLFCSTGVPDKILAVLSESRKEDNVSFNIRNVRDKTFLRHALYATKIQIYSDNFTIARAFFPFFFYFFCLAKTVSVSLPFINPVHLARHIRHLLAEPERGQYFHIGPMRKYLLQKVVCGAKQIAEHTEGLTAIGLRL